jgi:hypothetical protein
MEECLMSDKSDMHTLLADRDFGDVSEELEEDDIKASDIGQGRSTLVLIPEEGLDPIVQSGMLNNAVQVYNWDYFRGNQD